MIARYIRSLWSDTQSNWSKFWFDASTAHTLAVVRICTGLMLAYIHAIWWFDGRAFFGPDALIDQPTIQLLHEQDYAWSYLWFTDSLWLIAIHQAVAILASLAMAAGLFGRLSTVLAWFLTLMVCHRATGLLFGLDQTVMMLAFGLVIAPSSSVLSISSLVRKRSKSQQNVLQYSSLNTFATRLVQLQLCAMYLFGGLGKMRGSMWWDGSAMWFSAASYEYQSNDMTWIGQWPLLAGLLCHLTIFWEAFYCVAVWPMRSRPIVLAIAFAVHAGIAIYLGMITFGVIMIVANLIFIPPDFMRRIFQAFPRWTSPRPSNTELRNAPSPQ